MEPSSQEKTAITTPQGLYKFQVMPFGLTNAPAVVFQRLMKQVTAGLNPEDGNEFFTAYIDNILAFPASLQEHLELLQRVIDPLREVSLTLNLVKCKFVRVEFDYLGHVITEGGLKHNPQLTNAVQKFARPSNLQDVRRFLGMMSCYLKFIQNFTNLTQALHHLTAKGVPFDRTVECGTAFHALKARLVTPPTLAYPCFTKDFTLDASIQGL